MSKTSSPNLIKPDHEKRQKDLLKADQNYGEKEQISMSFWERLKLEHETNQKLVKKQRKTLKDVKSKIKIE